ncbi:MAG: integrase domain-containing protein [Motiliproteus sp.]
MARKTNPLTNTEVKQAKPKDKEYSLVDGAGLSLRIKPAGSKLWLFNYYRPHSKKRANISFGIYPEVSLADARRKKEKARELLAQDIDPKLHREESQRQQQDENSKTLDHVIEQWFAIKQPKITPSYADDIIRSLRNHVLPKLGKWPVHQISAPVVIDALQPLAKSGKLEAVKRVTQRLNEVMVYAVNTGIIQHNPLAGVRHAFETPKVTNNPTLKPEQLPELMQALSTASVRIVTRCLIEWQLHTLTRPSEAAGARWDEIDRKQGLWVIPPERMKKRKEHSIPLTQQALALLDAIEPISGRSKFVFPSDINPRQCTNSSTANVALRRMGFKGRLTAHGMRALASTTLNDQGFDADVIEAALAHVDKNQVRGAYNRAQYLQRRQVMMTWWSDRIEQAAMGNLSFSAGRTALRLISD